MAFMSGGGITPSLLSIIVPLIVLMIPVHIDGIKSPARFQPEMTWSPASNLPTLLVIAQTTTSWRLWW